MKKILLGAMAAIMLTAGTASADGGFWFGGGVGNTTAWVTAINIQNRTAAAQTATVIFYNLSGTVIGSTTKSIAANGGWNFTTAAVGNIPSTSFDAVSGDVRGTVEILPNNSTNIMGYATIFNSVTNSGFNFRNPF